MDEVLDTVSRQGTRLLRKLASAFLSTNNVDAFNLVPSLSYLQFQCRREDKAKSRKQLALAAKLKKTDGTPCRDK